MNKGFVRSEAGENIWKMETEAVRSWLFVGEKKALLVDTLEQPADLEEEIKKVTDLPVMLVNTHADPDHITNNDQFDTAWMHPDEFAHYKEKAAKGAAQPMAIAEGEKIDLGGRIFEVLHIPGHTPGSIALLDRENRILVSGDTVSANPVFLFGPARNIPLFKQSLVRLKELSSEFDTIYTSHGPCQVGPDQIEKEMICLEECLNGQVPAADPPFPLPAKMYCSQ